MLVEYYYKTPPSQRQLRVGRSIQEIIATAMLQNHELHEAFDSVVITGVRVTADLKNATIFFSSSHLINQHRENEDTLQQKLNSIKWYFRSIIAKNMKTKHVPNIVFAYDTVGMQAYKMETLLDNISDMNGKKSTIND